MHYSTSPYEVVEEEEAEAEVEEEEEEEEEEAEAEEHLRPNKHFNP